MCKKYKNFTGFEDSRSGMLANLECAEWTLELDLC
jgi:hypothetical protein